MLIWREVDSYFDPPGIDHDTINSIAPAHLDLCHSCRFLLRYRRPAACKLDEEQPGLVNPERITFTEDKVTTVYEGCERFNRPFGALSSAEKLGVLTQSI